MVISGLLDGAASMLLWLINLLPTTGCGTVEWTTLNVGWFAYYVDVSAVASAAGTLTAVEAALAVVRFAKFVRGWLPF